MLSLCRRVRLWFFYPKGVRADCLCMCVDYIRSRRCIIYCHQGWLARCVSWLHDSNFLFMRGRMHLFSHVRLCWYMWLVYGVYLLACLVNFIDGYNGYNTLSLSWVDCMVVFSIFAHTCTVWVKGMGKISTVWYILACLNVLSWYVVTWEVSCVWGRNCKYLLFWYQLTNTLYVLYTVGHMVNMCGQCMANISLYSQ